MTRQDHVERSGTITLQGAPDAVFPLFGPDREREWAEGGSLSRSTHRLWRREKGRSSARSTAARRQCGW